MKYALWSVVVVLLFAGCETRSISNSGYRAGHRWGGDANPFYQGELTELDVLGAAPRVEATQENITRALANAQPPHLKRGDRVVLIQSGAPVPDEAMLDAVAPYFAAAPFSGVPPAEHAGLAESLRLRAAQGGYRYLVCYWGVLESAQQDKAGKAGSWVPIVGSFIPDQKQQMRIRLKALVVDVATGGWKMLTPAVYNDDHYDSSWTREATDQKLVLALKAKAYQQLVTDLVRE